MAIMAVIQAIGTLGPLALEAYDRYASNKRNAGIDESDGLSRNEKEELIEIRLDFAKVLVSIWKYSAMADGVIQDEEDELINEMIDGFWADDSLFPWQLVNQKETQADLMNTFNRPLSLDTIKEYVGDDTELALDLYDNACCIIAQDEKLKKGEEEILIKLAKELNLNSFDREQIENVHLGKIKKSFLRKWFS
ncbi:MAG: DUF533 domain-containing protein [Leptospiraceae bacterium]|nr:DUF533 domain-containing protein [Leptospiraceae bacterium]